MSDFGANAAEVRGRAHRFPVVGHKGKFKADEVRVVSAGGGKNSPPGNKDTAAPDLCGKETGSSGGAGGPTSYL